jgi:hypothetical protein
MFISFTNLDLVFTLHNDEIAWDDLLLLGFYHFYFYFYNFRDICPYARDPYMSTMNFSNIWWVPPHVSHFAFPCFYRCPRRFVEHCLQILHIDPPSMPKVQLLF